MTAYELTVKAGDAQKPYDGSALTCEDYELQGKLIDGHRVALVQYSGEQTEIGRSENIIVHFRIFDESNRDVTDNYRISFLPGKLKVTVPKN